MEDVGDGGDEEEEGRGIGSERGCFHWRDAAGRRSGRDSQPRFADAKDDANSDRN